MAADAREGVGTVAIEIDAPVAQVEADLGGVVLEVVALHLAVDVPVLIPLFQVELGDAVGGHHLMGAFQNVFRDAVADEILEY
jgi:hypothetical protein